MDSNYYHMQGIYEKYLNNDINKSVELRDRFINYLKTSTNIDDEKSIETAKSFVKEFENFENTNVSLMPLQFLYGNIAKAYLHSKNFKKAESYALAYLKLNELSHDEEGIKEGLKSIMDIHIVKSDFEIALYFCEEYLKKIPDDEMYLSIRNNLEFLISQKKVKTNNTVIQEKIDKFLNNTSMPKLYSILIDPVKLMKESGIRGLCCSMGISRKVAEGYFKYAEENKDKFIS